MMLGPFSPAAPPALLLPPMRPLVLAPLLLLLSLPVHAQQPGEALSTCFVENTTGRDRKDLAKWVFVAMGAHPEMKAMASISTAASDNASRAAGRIFTRLITETCVKEARAAFKTNDAMAFTSAFSVLGMIAMQEITNDKDVSSGLEVIQRYIDTTKINAVLSGK
jgi:glutamate mutase epsilon subunit